MEREKHIDARQVCGYEWQSPSILYFFMPWFYYKSGMLWGGMCLRDTMYKSGRKLFKPFVVYAIIGQVVLTICLLVEGETSLKPYLYSPIRSLVLSGNVGGNTPLWFIPSLFVVQCMAAWLLNKVNLPLLWAILSILLGYGLYLLNWQYVPTYIESAFLGLFFFGMGNWLRERQYRWWLILICGLMWLCAVVFGLHGADIRANSCLGNYFMGALVSLSGCIAINGLFKWLQPWIKCYVLQFIGRNAMIIYVTHWIVLLVVIRLILMDLLHIML